MSVEEIKDFYKTQRGKEILRLQSFWCIGKCKSIRRAIRRSRASITGAVFPKRPYNNRKHTLGREFNIRKKNIYEQIREVKTV